MPVRAGLEEGGPAESAAVMVRLLALFVVIGLAHSSAWATDLTALEAYANGKRATDLGRHTEALEWFEKALALVPADALYAFAMAQTLEALGRPADAFEAYKRVVRLPAAPPELVERAKARGRALRPKKKPKDVAAAPEPSSSGRYWPWVVAGSGLALLAGGVALVFVGDDERQEIRDATQEDGVVTGMTEAEAARSWEAAGTKTTAGAALLGVGGAAVLGGLGWWIFQNRRQAKGQAALPIDITPAGPGQAGISVFGRF